MLTALEKVDLLQNVRIFSKIQTESLVRIATIAQEVLFEDHQPLFNENDAADAMFVMLDGEVLVTHLGREEYKLSGFQVLGALALLAEGMQTVTASAIRPTRALRIGCQDLYDAMAEDIGVVRGILHALVGMVQAPS